MHDGCHQPTDVEVAVENFSSESQRQSMTSLQSIHGQLTQLLSEVNVHTKQVELQPVAQSNSRACAIETLQSSRRRQTCLFLDPMVETCVAFSKTLLAKLAFQRF
jgi:hypothetical protein